MVILGGIFSLMAAGGDGNPAPGQGTSSIYAPHSSAAFSVALFAVALGALVALALTANYLIRTATLAKNARRDATQQSQ